MEPWTGLEWICDRCGEVTLIEPGCRCQQPYDPVAVRRRHRDAVIRARRTDSATRRPPLVA